MWDRAAWIQWLLKDLDRLEAMAAAAQPSEVHHSGWAGLSSESGLTEAQEDLGEHRALELIHTGRLLNGTEATEWDLVNPSGAGGRVARRDAGRHRPVPRPRHVPDHPQPGDPRVCRPPTPDLTDTDSGGPKYVNTADTPLFHKGAQLFGANAVDVAAGGVPVIVEGPMDAIAITLAGGGRYIGVAPLGTSLTDEQASQLARIGKNPIVATDADIAGRVAAERDFWLLTAYQLDPRYAPLPEGSDPADMLALNGPAALTTVLDQARPLGDELINERLTSLPPDQAQLGATRVVAACPPECWDQASNTISSRLNVPLPSVRRTLLAHVKEWNIDPRRAAANPLQWLTTSRDG
jgi:Toprim-like